MRSMEREGTYHPVDLIDGQSHTCSLEAGVGVALHQLVEINPYIEIVAPYL